MDDLTLSELLAVKICHDLAGPLGAINNGTELLKDGSDDIYDRSLDLVEGSAKDAVARLMFFRQAYGMVNAEQEVSVLSLQELVNNMYASSQVHVTWPKEFAGSGIPQSVSALAGKLALNLIMLVAGTLIHGGTISVRPQKHQGKNPVSVRGEGKDVKLQEELLLLLTDPQKTLPMSIKNVHVFLIRKLADKLDLTLDVKHGSNFIEVTAT